MGIDVVVLDKNFKEVSDQEFKDNGFPSANIAKFGMTSWIPTFNNLIGQDDIVDRFAHEMKTAPNEMICQWCSHLDTSPTLHEDENLIRSYLHFIKDRDYSVVFW